MRRLLIPTLVFVACAVPALAQDAPKQAVPQDAPKQTQTQDAPKQTQDAPKQAQTPDAPKQEATPPAVAQNQDDALIRNTQAIERSVQTRLGLAGYTDVEMIPTSFLIRAKDPDGNPVMLVLGPESLTGSNDAVPNQGSRDQDSYGDEE